jgi:hypothetical protein
MHKQTNLCRRQMSFKIPTIILFTIALSASGQSKECKTKMDIDEIVKNER